MYIMYTRLLLLAVEFSSILLIQMIFKFLHQIIAQDLDHLKLNPHNIVTCCHFCHVETIVFTVTGRKKKEAWFPPEDLASPKPSTTPVVDEKKTSYKGRVNERVPANS